MSGDHQAAFLAQLLPVGDMPQENVRDVVGYFISRYGEPQISRVSSEMERLVFELPSRRLSLFRMVSTLVMFGGSVQLRAPLPPPCPRPGPTGGYFIPFGEGSVDYTINRSMASAIALALATRNWVESYRRIGPMLCAAICPAPCFCRAALSEPPTVTETTTVALRLLWIPIRWRVTVSINTTYNAICI